MAGVQLSVMKGQVKDSLLRVAVSLQTPPGRDRLPSDVVCVVDAAGAMGTREKDGLSPFDIAKQGVRMVAHLLGDRDRLGIVSFSNSAREVLPLTWMGKAGTNDAEGRLRDFLPSRLSGEKSIWKGLEAGLDCLKQAKESGRFGHLLLLTDGESADCDSIVPLLMYYEESNWGLPGSVSTIGFGLRLVSRWLVDLATAGKGSYSFVQEAQMLPDAIANLLGTLLATMAQDVCLSVELNGLELQGPGVRAGWVLEEHSGVKRLSLGSLQFGQSRDIVLELKAGTPGEMTVGATFTTDTGAEVKTNSVRVTVAGYETGPEADIIVEAQWCRSLFTEVLDSIVTRMSRPHSDEIWLACRKELADAGKAIEASPAGETESVKALLKDHGKCTAIFSRRDGYQIWDRQFLAAVMLAHKQQFCCSEEPDFPGVQLYGGELFANLRQETNRMIYEVPPPRPTAIPVNVYHDPKRLCLDGSCRVDLPRGSWRRLADLSKGDRVLGLGGAEVKVVCLVRTPCDGGRARLVELPGGLRLTPYHPVISGGQWRFAGELAEATDMPCEAVYSFVLSGGPALCVGGVACAGLGHGVQEGAAAHPYFATGRVLEDLSGREGFKAGLVELPANGAVLRDPETGLVCGLAPA
mmetsp:Transcript_114764/g.357441  ORF Transcript_114764/g.357441 Transcript_114764/m.357441 type:complete len:636 (+) Transcript_114764:86-1993(+)